MNGTIFLGFGTGRCGTCSLARLVNLCKNTTVGHERGRFLTTWYNPDEEKLEKLIEHLNEISSKGITVGEVSLTFLPRLEYICTKISNVKLVHIWRDKEEVVDSFMRSHRESRLDPGNEHVGTDPTPGSWGIFPIIDGYNKRQQYEFYWEMYERWAKEFPNAYQLNVNSLNSREEMNKLFDFLGIPEENRVWSERTYWNKERWEGGDR